MSELNAKILALSNASIATVRGRGRDAIDAIDATKSPFASHHEKQHKNV
jgi:hypothetical protein